MADIAMCGNGKCPNKEYCYRFRAIPNDLWQSYADFKPDNKGDCDGFWVIDGRRVRKMEEINK